MASLREYRDFDSLGTPFASIKNPRQEKGTIKVDMHLVQEVPILRLEDFLSRLLL
jgi:hypothetical protein